MTVVEKAVIELTFSLKIYPNILKSKIKLSRRAIIVRKKMPNPPLSHILINNLFKGPAHLVYYLSLNLNFRQNIKNLISNLGAIHVGIIHAKFEASSFTGVGGE